MVFSSDSDCKECNYFLKYVVNFKYELLFGVVVRLKYDISHNLFRLTVNITMTRNC